jgi:hypothetical protein
MNYVYRNIAAADSKSVIIGGKGKSNRPGVYTVHKLEIANLDTSSITVDVYLERIDIKLTEQVHGTKDNGNSVDEGGTDQYINKVSDIFYKIKGVVIPAGVTLSLFTDHPCRHSDEFDLVVAVTESAAVDVIADWEYTSERSGAYNESINRSDY